MTTFYFPPFSCIRALPLTLCLVLAVFLAIPTAYAESPEEKGLRIAIAVDKRDEGFEDSIAEQVMILRNKQGQESKRQLRVKVLEVQDDGNKSLFVFDNPRDVKGTAMLIHAHKDASDDQWLYLPALKRVKRISSSNKSGSFMGSEFSYEDLTAQEVEKFTYNYLREEPCAEWVCHVVERFPTEEHSGYKRQVAWYDTEELRTVKVDYYDRKDAHLKTLAIEGYQQYLDYFWRASTWTMTNHVTGKSTVMEWRNFKFKSGLTNRDFTKTGLKRVR